LFSVSEIHRLSRFPFAASLRRWLINSVAGCRGRKFRRYDRDERPARLEYEQQTACDVYQRLALHLVRRANPGASNNSNDKKNQNLAKKVYAYSPQYFP
jgi:hypothetical protein